MVINKRSLVILVTVLSIILIANGCNEEVGIGKSKLSQSENGNFTILVSNQSFEITPVDIKVLIDNKTTIDQEFHVKDQHNWTKFTFNLEKGKHTFKAESTKGNTSIETEFEIKDKHWAVLNYWYYPEDTDKGEPMPRQFTFGVKDHPVGAGD